MSERETIEPTTEPYSVTVPAVCKCGIEGTATVRVYNGALPEGYRVVLDECMRCCKGMWPK